MSVTYLQSNLRHIMSHKNYEYILKCTLNTRIIQIYFTALTSNIKHCTIVTKANTTEQLVAQFSNKFHGGNVLFQVSNTSTVRGIPSGYKNLMLQHNVKHKIQPQDWYSGSIHFLEIYCFRSCPILQSNSLSFTPRPLFGF